MRVSVLNNVCIRLINVCVFVRLIGVYACM